MDARIEYETRLPCYSAFVLGVDLTLFQDRDQDQGSRDGVTLRVTLTKRHRLS